MIFRGLRGACRARPGAALPGRRRAAPTPRRRPRGPRGDGRRGRLGPVGAAGGELGRGRPAGGGDRDLQLRAPGAQPHRRHPRRRAAAASAEAAEDEAMKHHAAATVHSVRTALSSAPRTSALAQPWRTGPRPSPRRRAARRARGATPRSSRRGGRRIASRRGSSGKWIVSSSTR